MQKRKVPLRRTLAKLLFLGMLSVGALSGMKVSHEEIENLMELMNRTEIVRVVKKDEPK